MNGPSQPRTDAGQPIKALEHSPPMNTDGHRLNLKAPRSLDVLERLGRGFLSAEAMLRGATETDREHLPSACRQLLDHPQHMTVVLQESTGEPLELKVLKEQFDGNEYARMILLTPRGSDRTVEIGIVRMDLGVMTPEVRRDILERRVPLGNILIRHDVLRRVEPKRFFRFDATSEIVPFFGEPSIREAFGRVATIHYDHSAAIELLEVVAYREDAPLGHS